MKRESRMKKGTFIKRTGIIPQQDDMIRVNCQKAGEKGHLQCGVCRHDYPISLKCPKCEEAHNGNR